MAKDIEKGYLGQSFDDYLKEQGAYEIDQDELAASDRLVARRLDAQMWTRRVGSRYARRLSRRLCRQCLRNSRPLLPFEGR